MSLDQIKLNPGQLADLFNDLLVEGGGRAHPSESPMSSPPPMLGHYAQKILILVKEPNHAFLSDDDLGFLTGVITACKMSLAEVGIVNLATAPVASIEDLQQSLKPSACWIFGIHPPSIGLPKLDDPDHRYLHQNVPIFWAPSLQQLAADPQAKRALWAQLKKHYGL